MPFDRGGVLDVSRRLNEAIRSLFRPAYEYVARHEDAWEILMAVLAIAFVATGFAGDFFPQQQATFDLVNSILTLAFVAEFSVRFGGSPRQFVYLKSHLLDLVALIPLARGIRILRLLRLLRLVRTFTGIHHVFTRADRLANYHELGTLVIAWFGTMFFCASAFYLAEGDVNPQMREPGDAIWWGIATLTGGTTDVRPITEEGRIITSLLLIVGVGLFTAITAVFVSFLVRASNGPGSETHDAAGVLAADYDAAGRLRELEALRDGRLISEEEYARGRDAVLRRLGM